MALERLNSAFAGSETHADSSGADRAGIQALIKGLQDVAVDFGLKQRHLRLLTALASFLREFTSDNRPIVFASNAALSRRTCGMPVPTLQRALRELCALGFIKRNLSPNGKRYTHRDAEGAIVEAFGIDLSPLVAHAAEIQQFAQAQEERKRRIKLLRDKLSLLRHNFPEDSPKARLIRSTLRRRQNCEHQLVHLLATLNTSADETNATEVNPAGKQPTAQEAEPRPEADLAASVPSIYEAATKRKSSDLTCSAHQTDTHYQSSDPNIFESKKMPVTLEAPCHQTYKDLERSVSAVEVKLACPDAVQYAQQDVKTWEELLTLAIQLAPMIGISERLSTRAIEAFGPSGFAVTILCLVQKFGVIRSPAAYLSRLMAPRGQSYSPYRFLKSLARPSALSSLPCV